MAPKKRSSTKSAAPAARPETSDEVDADELETEAHDAEASDDTDGSSLSEHVAEALEGDAKRIVELGDELVSGKKTSAGQAARILDGVLEQKPEAITPIIDRLIKAVLGPEKRPAQTAANALPVMARVQPARVARHLPKLIAGFDAATPIGKDGMVRTFAGLCTASVAYQKRLEGVLNKALSEADAKTLQKWTEVVLPALKGEPHARARATVEGRLGRIPKAVAQKIADFLGIKLRLRYR
jgi:hypothetical protein